MTTWLNSFAGLDNVLGFFLDVSLKALALLLFTGCATLLLKRAPAARRHLLWTLSVGAVLLLPVLTLSLPKWQLGVLPKPAKSSAVVSAIQTRLSGPEETSPAAGAVPANSAASDARLIAPEVLPLPKSKLAGNTSPDLTLPTSTSPAPKSNMPSPWGRFQIARWWVLMWCFGVLTSLVPLLFGTWTVLRLIRRAGCISDPDWIRLAGEVSHQLRQRHPVQLLLCDRAIVPMTWGAGPSVLLLPSDALDWPEERRRFVLLHELAHVKRLDCLTQMLAHLACAIYWFNPLAWLAARRMRIERERACDDLVLASGSKPSEYASLLLQIATNSSSSRLANCAAIAVAQGSRLEGRLLAILDKTRRREGLTRQILLFSILLVATTAVPLAALKLVQRQARLPASYEKATGSGADLAVNVGPNRMEIRAVARAEGYWNPLFEDGRGQKLSNDTTAELRFQIAPELTDESRDTVHIYLKPGGHRFDILEMRVFDHETRVLLNDGSAQGVKTELSLDGTQVRLQRSGTNLPERVDLWLRAHCYPEKETIGFLKAAARETARIDSATLMLRELRAGAYAYEMRRGPDLLSQIKWNTSSEPATDDEVTAVFRQTGPWRLGRYQVCAVDQAGRRFFPAGAPHFIDFARMGRTQVVNFPVRKADLSHFEWRPFGERHRFYFSGVQLPRIKPRAFKSDKAPPTAAEPLSVRTAPVLQGLAAQNETRSDHSWAAWNPNGADLETSYKPIPGHSITSSPDRRLLWLWFSDLWHLDERSWSRVSLLDNAGQALKELDPVDLASLRQHGIPQHPMAQLPFEHGFIAHALSLSRQTPLPEAGQVQLEFSAGDWRDVLEFPAQVKLAMVWPGASIVASGKKQNRAFISIERDRAATTQLDCVALTRQGKALESEASILLPSSSRGAVIETFYFSAPQSQIEKFRVRMRPVWTVVYRNVSFKQGHLTQAKGGAAATPEATDPIFRLEPTPSQVTALWVFGTNLWADLKSDPVRGNSEQGGAYSTVSLLLDWMNRFNLIEGQQPSGLPSFGEHLFSLRAALRQSQKADLVNLSRSADGVFPILRTADGSLEAARAAQERPRYFVRLVVDLGEMTFEGKATTWEELPELLAKVSNRSQTVFELAVATDTLTLAQLNQIQSRVGLISEQHGFEYLSYVGVHPLGTLGTSPARASF